MRGSPAASRRRGCPALTGSAGRCAHARSLRGGGAGAASGFSVPCRAARRWGRGRTACTCVQGRLRGAKEARQRRAARRSPDFSGRGAGRGAAGGGARRGGAPGLLRMRTSLTAPGTGRPAHWPLCARAPLPAACRRSRCRLVAVVVWTAV